MYWPVSNLIWTVSVRRKQKKLQTELSEDEIRAQKQRARFISVVICFVFSILYNLSQLGVPTDG
jgi:hypothetical protein